MFVASGIAIQVLSLLSFRHASKTVRKPLLPALTGVALFAASVWMIGMEVGFELGLAWAMSTISVVAYVHILPPFFSATSVGHNRVPSRLKEMPRAPSGSKVRMAVRLFSAGPLYLTCALALSLLIATKPWTEEITRLFAGGLLNPVFWSVGALHATVDPDLWRVLYTPVLVTAIAALGYVLL